MSAILYATTIFASAFLLFLVQPIVSKHILPWFGGSASVWATCLVFFQTLLLLGYAYADQLSRHLSTRRQVGIHAALLAVSVLSLPVLAGSSWKPAGSEDPGLYILGMLAATVGLPYLILSTTGPLIQSWAARSGEGPRVYRLYSLSNLASLLALLSYPFLIEPWLSLQLQSSIWSVVYTGFALLCIASGLRLVRHAHPASQPVAAPGTDTPVAPGLRQYAGWTVLAALGSWLLLAVTNHITQNIAAIPFLWIVPLTLYLLSFVLCFESDRWYRRGVFLPLMFFSQVLCAYGLNSAGIQIHLKLAIPLYCAGLFFTCMVLHGELALMRPPPAQLTRFYLALSLGGAAGGVLVGLVAPRVLPSFYELGIGMILVALLVAGLLRRRLLLCLSALLFAIFFAVMLGKQILGELISTRLIERNFYGRLLIRHVTTADGMLVRRLLHGTIMHGEEYLHGPFEGQPGTYYGPGSGIGRALIASTGGARRVGVVGLGTGTLAAYGQHGDLFRFYDIDAAVITIAQRDFGYLRNSHAQIETVLGDARLSLEREPANGFDLLAIDAFSGDAIPVHLLTREALTTYRKHLKRGGVIAFHVSNRYLALAPVVARLAQEQQMHAVLISDLQPTRPSTSSEWVLVTDNPQRLRHPAIAEVAQPVPATPTVGVWTDDASNLLSVLK